MPPTRRPRPTRPTALDAAADADGDVGTATTRRRRGGPGGRRGRALHPHRPGHARQRRPRRGPGVGGAHGAGATAVRSPTSRPTTRTTATSAPRASRSGCRRHGSRRVMASFAELGDVQGSRTEQEDVTTEVIDVASRIRTQEVSLGRLRGFLDRGHLGGVGDPARVRDRPPRGRPRLAAGPAGLPRGPDRRSPPSSSRCAPRTPEPKPAAQKDELEDAGFLAGLSGGWNALLDVLLVAATVLGALLPFAWWSPWSGCRWRSGCARRAASGVRRWRRPSRPAERPAA